MFLRVIHLCARPRVCMHTSAYTYIFVCVRESVCVRACVCGYEREAEAEHARIQPVFFMQHPRAHIYMHILQAHFSDT